VLRKALDIAADKSMRKGGWHHIYKSWKMPCMPLAISDNSQTKLHNTLPTSC